MNPDKKLNSQHIMRLFLGKKYEECLKLIEIAKNNDDDMLQLQILQAGCWTHLNINQEEAMRQLMEVICVEPNNAFAWYGLGLNYYVHGELEKCIDPFTRAGELNQATKSRASILKHSAMKVLQLLKEATQEFADGRFSIALKLLSIAVIVDPENMKIKQIVKEHADKFLQKLVTNLEDEVMADDDIEMILNHVEFLVNSEKFEAADKMIPVDELLRTARGWFLKGHIKYMMGYPKLSILCNKKAFEMDQTIKKARDMAGKAERFVDLIETASKLMKLNKNEEAIQVLTKALEIDEHNKRIVQAIYFQRAAAKYNMGTEQEAFDDYLQFESLQNKTGMIMDGIKF